MKSALIEIKNATAFETVADNILSHTEEYDIVELILPDGEKNIYQECAYIIYRMPICFIENYALELLKWFQDLNWPGVEQIFEAICRLPNSKLVPIKKGIKTADDLQDEEWAYNLREKFERYLA